MTSKKTLFTRSAALASVLGLAAPAAFAAEALTVVGWGGPGQEVQSELFFETFTEDTGIALQQDSWGGGYGILKSKVETGNVNWDVIQVEADEMELGCLDDIYVPLDWDTLGGYDDFFPGTATDCGAGVITWSFALAYDADAVSEAPTDWSAFWDLETWPGKRALRKSAKGTLEIALLADGVPGDEIYDMLSTDEGVDRAFAKLDEIKSDLLWWSSGAQVLQMLSANQVALTSAYDGSLRLYAESEGKNFDLTFNQALYASDYWVVLKGTEHEEEAMKLVAHLIDTDRMAEYPQKLPYGVPNEKAMSMVPEETAAKLLTSPENIASAVPIDADFWIDNGEELNKRFNAWLAQ